MAAWWNEFEPSNNETFIVRGEEGVWIWDSETKYFSWTKKGISVYQNLQPNFEPKTKTLVISKTGQKTSNLESVFQAVGDLQKKTQNHKISLKVCW